MTDNQYYDKLWQNAWKDADLYGPSSASRERIITKLIKNNLFVEPLLDIGCGSGKLLHKIILKCNFQDVTGSDFSEDAIHLCLKYGIRAFQADLLNISSFPQKKSNSLICSEVLEHIENDSLAIYNLNQLLNSEGKIIITVPNSMKYWSKHDTFSGHIRRYELSDVIKKLESSGFVILDSFVWGAFIYSVYLDILTRINPEKIMTSKTPKNKILKKIGGKILYYLFFIDDLLIFTNRGRRIFIVAKKKSKD